MSESIYNAIREEYEETTVLPYQFQKIDIHGKDDLKISMCACSEMYEEEMERECLNTIKRLKEYLDKGEDELELNNYLDENAQACYPERLRRLLREHINCGYFDSDDIYNAGIALTTKGEYVEAVKLGILILGSFENDFTKKIMMTLGYHSEFTMFVLAAIETYDSKYEMMLDLLKNTDGYGRLFTAVKFIPIKEEDKKYIVEDLLCDTSYVKKEIATDIMTSIYLEEYLYNLEITEENFRKISYLLAFSLYNADIANVYASGSIISKYVVMSQIYAAEYIDMAALIVIRSGMENYLNDVFQRDKDRWDDEFCEKIIEICDKTIEYMPFNLFILNELETDIDYPYTEMEMFLFVVKYIKKKYNYEVSTRIFINMVVKAEYDLRIIEYFVKEGDFEYFSTLESSLNSCTDESWPVFNEERTADTVSRKNLVDVWYCYILRAYRKEKKYNEDLFLKSLFARCSLLRTEAILSLAESRNKWSENVKYKLAKFIEDEPDETAKRLAISVMDEYDIDISEYSYDTEYLKDGRISIKKKDEKIIIAEFDRDKDY